MIFYKRSAPKKKKNKKRKSSQEYVLSDTARVSL